MIGLFKTEVIQRQGPWRTREAVEFATLAWVDWFNHRRLLGPIGFVHDLVGRHGEGGAATDALDG